MHVNRCRKEDRRVGSNNRSYEQGQRNVSQGSCSQKGCTHEKNRSHRQHGNDGTAKAAITTTKTVAVAPAAASEVNAVIGSFNGRWAVRVENAKGSAVSIKVGGKWYKVTATSDSFVFSRKSRVGATVLVKVWVAGDLQNEQTIKVK